jgi:hypothetical protein
VVVVVVFVSWAAAKVAEAQRSAAQPNIPSKRLLIM